MKNKTYNFSLFTLITLMILSLFMLSCNDDDAGGSNIPPVIEAVYTAREQLQIDQGTLENTVNLRGAGLATTTSVFFNGVEAYFNPALATNENLFVVIPEDAPVISDINKIRVETPSGVAEYDFPLLDISGFTTGNDGTGDTVTIFGGDFNLPGVTYEVLFSRGSEEDGNLEERVATIISQTRETITVYVPEGTTQAFINVVTSLNATATSTSFGFNYPIYVDSVLPGWDVSGWSGSQETASTEQALGQFSVKRTSDQWGGLTFWPPGGSEPVPGDYQSITVKLFALADGQTVRLAFNDFETQVELEMVAGEWTLYDIPLTDFYPPGTASANIWRFDFQASSEGTSVYFVDDFGLL